MSSFTFLRSDPRLSPIADIATVAERVYAIDPATCASTCRKAMENAVKWMYSVDESLEVPHPDSLVNLIGAEEFREVVDHDLLIRMDYIRKVGNRGTHSGSPVTPAEAMLCLRNLHCFLDFVAYCYGEDYEESPFDPAGVSATEQPAPVADTTALEADLKRLMAENAALREELTRQREAKQPSYTPKPLDLTEYETRKLYIDEMLRDAGWIEGRNWLNEVPLDGMPNRSGTGRADYVLYGDDGRPLAIIEAKRTCKDVGAGRQEAKLYADSLEKRYGRRPVIFLTNGFDTRIVDHQYPERKVATVCSKRDLEKLFSLRRMRTSLKNIMVNKAIAGRYYQEGAVKSVCQAFDEKNRRKALLVMATGSGKTRTVIALCDVLLRHGWVKNILFLADRNSLVTQAKRSFVNLLPDLSVTNLCEEKDNYSAHCVFSTYQTMMNCIDDARDEEGKLFTCGHFDLVICDEAHRSIYNKYKDIFTYFDAPLVGLTATPKDEVEKSTYEVFELGKGAPTYGYELGQAVNDGYLVSFMSVETRLKFIEQGIIYDELSDEDKEEYEATFEKENGLLPERIDSSAINTWVFNDDTIREVLHVLMTDGLKIDYGQKVGKSIIFARNHRHAEKILDVFNKEYPHLPGFAMVIDNQTAQAQSAIDDFSDPKKLPQIAISVDMLDTGIDVPEVLNLVFFKKVMSKAKFWQMIGRGTRLCPGLIDGKDKSKFYIFDFCGNFEFFRMNKDRPTANQMALQGAIFRLKAQIAFKLQELAYQTEALIAFRGTLVDDMVRKVRELNRDNFAVKQHLRYVEKYADPANYASLTYEDTLLMEQELAPLLTPDEDDPKAVRFDALLYGIELATLAGKSYGKARSDLLKKVSAVANVSNIPEIMAQSDLIGRILHTDYLDRADISDLEHIRENIRSLMKYLPPKGNTYTTDFDDQILSTDWHEAELDNDDLQSYRAKAEFYVRQHPDHLVIAKLRSNQPLTDVDISTLESILWSEVGTKQDYEAEYGQKPLGEFVREIVGLDMKAAKEAFADYLNNVQLDSRQIYFVNQIVEYIVHNGVLKDMSVLQEPPFTDQGSIVDVFADMNVWMGIRKVIDQINANASFVS